MKYYVVWVGKTPGVYASWAECKEMVEGEKDAKYKAFPSKEEAEMAFADDYKKHIYAKKKEIKQDYMTLLKPTKGLSVDAACSGNPGDMEYRGVWIETGVEAFRSVVYKEGTNNIGEFLAIVHGLALLKKHNVSAEIFSDSKTALAWVREGRCKTKLEQSEANEALFERIEAAEKYLKNNSPHVPINKWQTEHWGEIPADFGRK